MRSQIVKKIVAVVLYLYTSTVMFGQSGGGSEGPPPPDGRDSPEGVNLPLDDNIEILLLIGLLYGCYLVYKKYRTKNTAA